MTVKDFTLHYDGAPKSLNEGGAGSRRHWGVGYREKKEWEEIYGLLLMEAKVPRGASFVKVTPSIVWHNRIRRDEPNYESAVSKPLLDTLVKGNWLADDSPEFVRVERLTFGLDTHRLGPRLVIRLEATYE